jgi:hypothetical protein
LWTVHLGRRFCLDGGDSLGGSRRHALRVGLSGEIGHARNDAFPSLFYPS